MVLRPRPPVQQPGVVPLRPLTLGDLFGGATLTIRRNPLATVGLAALVTLGFMVLPISGTVVLGATAPCQLRPRRQLGPRRAGWQSRATRSSAFFSWLASVVVTGLIMRVVEQAVVGRRISAERGLAAAAGDGCPPCSASASLAA